MKWEWLIIYVLAGCMVPILASCSLPDKKPPFVHEFPKPEELVGTWKIDENSVKLLKEDNLLKLAKTSREDHMFILRSDNTCYYRSYSGFSQYGRYISSEGTWKIVYSELDIYEGPSPVAVSIELEPTDSNFVSLELMLKRENGKLVMWKFFSDPDRYRFINFHKVTNTM
jgi:hypothetical protein